MMEGSGLCCSHEPEVGNQKTQNGFAVLKNNAPGDDTRNVSGGDVVNEMTGHEKDIDIDVEKGIENTDRSRQQRCLSESLLTVNMFDSSFGEQTQTTSTEDETAGNSDEHNAGFATVLRTCRSSLEEKGTNGNVDKHVDPGSFIEALDADVDIEPNSPSVATSASPPAPPVANAEAATPSKKLRQWTRSSSFACLNALDSSRHLVVEEDDKNNDEQPTIKPVTEETERKCRGQVVTKQEGANSSIDGALESLATDSTPWNVNITESGVVDAYTTAAGRTRIKGSPSSFASPENTDCDVDDYSNRQTIERPGTGGIDSNDNNGVFQDYDWPRVDESCIEEIIFYDGSTSSGGEDKNKSHDSECHQCQIEQADRNRDGTRTSDYMYASSNSQQSPNNTSNGNSQSKSNSQSSNELQDGIAREEDRAVRRWRIFLIIVLLVLTIVISLQVHSYFRNKELREFEEAFAMDSEKVFDSLSNTMDINLIAIDSLALLMASSAREKNETWPFIVLPDFATKASKVRILTQAIALQQFQYVDDKDRKEWETYSKANEMWVQEVIDVERRDPTFHSRNYRYAPDYNGTSWPTRSIWYGEITTNMISFPLKGTGPYAPSWQSYPLLPSSATNSPYNFDAMQHRALGPGIRKVVRDQNAVIGPVLNFADSDDLEGGNVFRAWASRHVDDGIDPIEPIVAVLYPILDTAHGAVTTRESNSKVVGVIAGIYLWKSFLENILPSSDRGLVVVFENSCRQSFTYMITGKRAEYLGQGDLTAVASGHVKHEHHGDMMHFEVVQNMVQSRRSEAMQDILGGHDRNLHDGGLGGLPLDNEFCAYTIKIFPCSAITENVHFTDNPRNFSIICVFIFGFTALVFFAYDTLVRMRQKKVMQTAIQSTAIVSSLFPSNIRKRLMEEATGAQSRPPPNKNEILSESSRSKSLTQKKSAHQPTKLVLRSYLNSGGGENEASEVGTKNKPIADLFADTTVLFADIAGFTAWSSVREPTQVFTLLEVVYGAFDEIAAKRKVFKVETIGDSYVAVTGLPDPKPDHAVAMAKFAFDCREQFNILCTVLERSLGPETGDLKLRIGLHSGPVTAGVLRGQKSRFQLFGDTVNTASRMESTGRVNKIQVSQKTADLLREARKGRWLQPREEIVEAKGKGLMTTYWIEPRKVAQSIESSRTSHSSSVHTSSVSHTSSSSSVPSFRAKRRDNSCQTERLVNWNVDVLERLLKKIALRRSALNEKADADVVWKIPSDAMVLKEVKEVIELPEYNCKYIDQAENPDSVILGKEVRSQLHEFVVSISRIYHDNPFHNFPHASHVGMSVSKLLSRIVAPDKTFEKHEQLHDHTYGITSDPLTQFACIFSALIHDADHSGVPNAQLEKEETQMAKTYEGKSIAEQNSINRSWELLTRPSFVDLRKAIAQTQQEEERFRQLVVNAVCATDIIDKDLKNARNQRWEKAFSLPVSSAPSLSGNTSASIDVREQINRRATIVIEHIIQASDIAHTMQHWHIYIKWNERLYDEMYKAYVEGRAESDPTEGWYEGEIGFFDYYIIPLAKKLSECGVFGVCSDEYLDYARMNRNEWEKKGRAVVSGYAKKHNKEACCHHQISSPSHKKSSLGGETQQSSCSGTRDMSITLMHRSESEPQPTENGSLSN